MSMKIEGYTKDIAATATPVNLVAPSGVAFKFAKDVLIRCPAANTSDLKIGSAARQEFTVVKSTFVALSEINRAGQSAKYSLADIYVKAGTNGDDVEICLVDPSDE